MKRYAESLAKYKQQIKINCQVKLKLKLQAFESMLFHNILLYRFAIYCIYIHFIMLT